MIRDYYGAISLESLSSRTRKQVENLVKKASKAEKIDEHGGWEFGAEWEGFTEKARIYTQYGGEKYCPEGWALNWSLYGYAKDCHNKKFLALIQIREARREKRGYYIQVRKNYFLLGRNEDGSVFAHCVGAGKIHSSIKKGKCPVKAVQDWIFGKDYKKVLRQGDLGLYPSRKPKGVTLTGSFLYEESHRIDSKQICIAGEKIYLYNPAITHLRGVHPRIEGQGWYQLLEARRAESWDFAKPTID